MKSTLTFYSATLQPLEPRKVSIAGSFLRCVDCAVPVTVTIDGKAELPMSRGISFHLPAGDRFSSFVVKNLVQANNPISFYIGDAATDIAITSLVNAPTYLKGTGVLNMANNDTLNFTGSDSGHLRKQIMVCNNSAAGALLITDAAGKAVGLVLPMSAWTLDITGLVTVANTSGQGIQVIIGETFYS